MKTYFIVIAMLFASVSGQFTDIGQSLQGLSEGVPCWGDFDGDGDLDLHISGYNSSNNWRMYKNNAGSFTLTAANVFPARYSYSSLCDWDNDGDLDGISTGFNGTYIRTYLWRNNGDDTYTSTQLPTGINSGSMAWGDYDNDGDEDLLLNGWNGSTVTSKLYRNDNGTFTDINAGLTGVQYSASSWCDWDGDGDLDILYSGYTGSARFIGSYRNDTDSLTYLDLGITPVHAGSISWADYDADGDPDLLITGHNGTSGFTEIYTNAGGVFTPVSSGLPGLYWSSGEWGDYDNDGDYDILLSGTTDGSTKLTAIYSNNSGIFTEEHIPFEDVWKGGAKWGDYDNDGDLDIVVMGESSIGNITKIYRNDHATQNKPPFPPENLVLSENNGKLMFSFDAGYDSPDPVASLTYSIQIDSLGKRSDVKKAHANGDGVVSIPSQGNLGQSLNWTLNKLYLPQETVWVEWKVQALDIKFSGSIFESDSTLYQFRDISLTGQETMKLDDTLYVENSYADSILNYTVRIDDDPAFGSYFEDTLIFSKKNSKDGYLGIALGDLSFSGSLIKGTTYYWKIRPNYSNVSRNSGFSKSSLEFVLFNEFSEVSSALESVSSCHNSWFDYDSDGDPDLLVTGNNGSAGISKIYRNDSGSFMDINAGLIGLTGSFSAWGDYDNDGDGDLLLSGYNSTLNRITRLYKNNGGVFEPLSIAFPNIYRGSADWGDYDNDGDLDILISGYDGSPNVSKVLRNNGNDIFEDMNVILPGVDLSSSVWGDYDNDGDLDILITGYLDMVGNISRIYRNDSGTFSDIGAGLTGVNGRSALWGDYDNDGDLDILISGSYISKIYRNDSGIFTETSNTILGVNTSSSVWGDLDNDGDLDLIISGENSSVHHTLLYLNDNGTFIQEGSYFTGVADGSISLADFDNDNDLDVLVSGNNGTGVFTKLYRNNIADPNYPPSAPTGLNAVAFEDRIAFLFTAASDTETPAAGLNYNINIELNDELVKPAMSDLTSGMRKKPSRGNLDGVNNWDLKRSILPQEQIQTIWKVQAVDGCYAGSPFASQTITLYGEDLKLLCEPYLHMNDSLSWSASYSANILNYTIQIDDDANFASPFEQTVDKSKNLKAAYLTKALDELDFADNLTKDISYYWRIRPNYSDFRSSDFSQVPGVFKIYPLFTKLPSQADSNRMSCSAWCDYDNDGDLDLAVHSDSLHIYTNNSGELIQTISLFVFPQVKSEGDNIFCNDMNNDGYIDIIISSGSNLALLYNDSGFIGEPGLQYMSGLRYIDFGDIDNDGDIDIAGFAGDYSGGKVLINNDGDFSEEQYFYPGYFDYAKVKMIDFDNDGDTDIFFSGTSVMDYQPYSLFVENNNGFIVHDLNVGGYQLPFFDFGDYDNDGDMDIAISGSDNFSEKKTDIYRNDGTQFTNINAILTGLTNGDIKWLDFDNDGDLDLLTSGEYGISHYYYVTKMYRNENGSFVAAEKCIDDLNSTKISITDYDNDGDTDLFVSGRVDSLGSYTSSLYRNNAQYPNTTPLPPSNINVNAGENGMTVSFSPGSDTETPVPGLSYNIEMGVNEYSGKSAMSDLSTGYRRIVAAGNIGQVNSWSFNRTELPSEIIPQEIVNLWCKVQSVDHSFSGSAFADGSTQITNRDLMFIPKNYMTGADELVWEYIMSDSVATYTVQVSTDTIFMPCLEQTLDISKNSKTGYFGMALQDFDFFSSLTDDTEYFWRVKPNHVNPSKQTAFNSEPNTFIFNPALVPPANITITVDGQYITLDWSGVKTVKAEPDYYTVYSSNDPYAEFPAGWTEETSTSNTNCILISPSVKKFYCVTAGNFAKTTKVIKNTYVKKDTSTK